MTETPSSPPSQSYIILGLARSGLAAARFILASLLSGKKEGGTLYLWDDHRETLERTLLELRQETPPNAHITAIEPATAPWSLLPWAEIAALIPSPGIPLTHPAPHPLILAAQEAGCPIFGDDELLYRTHFETHSGPRYIGVTGTNGKSTTSSLIAHCLSMLMPKEQIAFGGNIGVPSLALPALPPEGITVLEMSSYSLDLLDRMHFHIAILLNMSEHHLDRHGDMAGYQRAKCRIFRHQRYDGLHPDYAIIGVDTPTTKAIFESHIAEHGAGSAIPISATGRAAGGVALIGRELFIDMPGLKGDYLLAPLPELAGAHNAENIAATIATLLCLSFPTEHILATLFYFKSLPHRLELLGTYHGVTYVNDSKATNAAAAAKALSAYQHYRRIYWIAGGRPDADGITTLATFFPQIRHAFFIGEAMEYFATQCEGHCAYSLAGTLDNALTLAKAMAEADGSGDPAKEREDTATRDDAVILFAPACPSLDQFTSFEQRGDVFREWVTNSANGPLQVNALQ